MTVDGQTLADQTLTLRDRDTTQQERVLLADLPHILREKLEQV